ncbi:MAG: sensor domain-containing diguanylate cyclase [Sulfurimonas sp.]|nr:sensor domain-containing diguanylate cyclase [Sulfurimonas sp.]
MGDNLSLHDKSVQLKTLEEFNQTIKTNNKDIMEYIHIMEEHVFTTKTDKTGIIIDVTNSFCELTGFNKDELIGKTHTIIKHPDTKEIFFKKMWKTILNGDIWENDIKNLKKDGSTLWLHVVIFPRYAKNRRLIGFSSIRHNITTTKKLEQEAIHDVLTGLFNRRHYNKIITKELQRAKRGQASFTFVMMDIDYFKQYNDTYGHHKGDEALKTIAHLLTKKLSRGSDYCFRLGGEEFAFFFTGLTAEESIDYTKNICLEVEKLHINHIKNKVSKYLTASFGIVISDMQTSSYSEEFIYAASDKALYKAKKAGRNQVVMHIEK